MGPRGSHPRRIGEVGGNGRCDEKKNAVADANAVPAESLVQLLAAVPATSSKAWSSLARGCFTSLIFDRVPFLLLLIIVITCRCIILAESHSI